MPNEEHGRSLEAAADWVLQTHERSRKMAFYALLHALLHEELRAYDRDRPETPLAPKRCAAFVFGRGRSCWRPGTTGRHPTTLNVVG